MEPLLFNLSLNDIVNISNNTKFVIYALVFSWRKSCRVTWECQLNTFRAIEVVEVQLFQNNTERKNAVLFRPKDGNKGMASLVDRCLIFDPSLIELIIHFMTVGIYFILKCHGTPTQNT